MPLLYLTECHLFSRKKEYGVKCNLVPFKVRGYCEFLFSMRPLP